MTKALSVQPTGKNIAITGGYGHLGKAITLALAENEANVFVLARSKVKFDEAFYGLSLKGSINFVETDISSDESLEQAFKGMNQRGVQIDGLINNAFYLRSQLPEAISREDFNFSLDGTLSSVFSCIKLAVKFLSPNASIINVCSMYGLVAPDFDIYNTHPQFLNPPHYGAAKAGVLQLSKYYAAYLGSKGIRVNAVSPGPFPSGVVLENEGFIDELSKHTLLNRIGTPEELAGVFVFLMSEASKYITGQNFIVDGGWTVR